MSNAEQISGRLIAIGDIHGMAAMLEQLIVQIAPTAADQLVFMGDYVDRGPHCREAIEFLLKLKMNFPGTVFLRGNHDQMLLDALVEMGTIQGERLRDISPLFKQHGPASDLEKFLSIGHDTIASYNATNLADIPLPHIEFLQQTQLYWQHKPYVFAHAGLTPNINPSEQDPYILLWERNSPAGKDGEIHIVGHQPTQGEPKFEPGRINVDTGAVYGHTLTACDVFTNHIWQVKY